VAGMARGESLSVRLDGRFMLKLRGHHLICLHFFQGEGYSPNFVEQLNDVMRRARAGEPIVVVQGSDSVCIHCPHLSGTICRSTGTSDSEIREMDENALDLLAVKAGALVLWEEIERKIFAVFPAWYRSYCGACEWRSACERHDSFSGFCDETA